jgi:hypothetical protein
MHEKLKEWMRFQKDAVGRPLQADSRQLFERWLGPKMRCAFDEWRAQEPVISMSGRSHFDAARDMVEL